jgi:hypothetical protein
MHPLTFILQIKSNRRPSLMGVMSLLASLYASTAWSTDLQPIQTLSKNEHMIATQKPSDNTFGRLFNAQSERDRLDILRKTQRVNPNQTVVRKPIYIPSTSLPITLPKPITLQGYVKRNDDGKNTVWINNQPVQENSVVDEVSIGRLSQQQESKNAGVIKSKTSKKAIDRLAIKIPANGKHIQLKAGQRYDPETNQIKEVTTVAKEKQLQLLETLNNDELSVE